MREIHRCCIALLSLAIASCYPSKVEDSGDTETDLTPPEIACAPIPDGQIAGQDIPVSCDATDNVGIYVVEAYLEQPGDAAWQQVVLEPTEGASPYLGTLPGDSILPDRMDVVFGAKDLSKNTATSPPHGFEVPYTFTVIAE